MSKPTQLQINIAKKTLAKIQKFVEIVLKMIMIVLKLLNGYSVISVYYGCTLHVLFLNYLITTFDNSVILNVTPNSIVVCLCLRQSIHNMQLLLT